MMDDELNELMTTEEEAPEAVAEDHHPHEGIASENFSSPPVGEKIGRLVLKRNGAETEIEYPIAPPAVIGRFDPTVGPIDVDLSTIPEGSYVSRKHAKITCEDGAWKISDMGSSNGTYVLRSDFERIEEADIDDNTEIAFGNARFVFHLPAACEAEPAAD